MRNLVGAFGSAVRNQPLTSTAEAVGLNNSIVSVSGNAVEVSTSLMTIAGIPGCGSSAPGEPPRRALARQFAPLSGACVAPALVGTREKSSRSGTTGQGASSA